MALDIAKTKKHLADFEFEPLFIEELGWDRVNTRMEVSIDGHTFELLAAAQKRGVPAFVCHNGDTSPVPDSRIRKLIERQVAKNVHEHLIIFVDGKRTTQVWQWVRREPTKPTAWREHTYRTGQPGDSLIQKLQVLAVSLTEEKDLTLSDVTIRQRRAFDVDRVAKRFYEDFKDKHSTFLKFLKGIPEKDLQRWYVCIMLNRLMFIYFLQKKGFLDGDPNYLRNKFTQFRKGAPKGHFYRDFLCPLFFEGFAKWEDERSRGARDTLGKIPYLNGGIFQKHQIEKLHGKTIDIPDEPFESLFAFFDTYQWHLDDRPTANDGEICPDVLGYVFEKYINQKQMGAYYTKEDITEYISKNTILPFLFDAARANCPTAFEGDNSVWRLLEDDPDCYIYHAVRHGAEIPLPPEIQEGVDPTKPRLFERRKHWNKRAPRDYGLPTEIWREVVARRQRYEEVRTKLATGQVQAINDFITYNLDIRQFTQDVIQTCENPQLLLAFWNAIEKVTVLDPTCGSGAFLYAALKILAGLYEACLDRMESFLEEWAAGTRNGDADCRTAFNETLNRVRNHPNRNYFILKSIVTNNLYGVDIQEEAVEICRLRLFLALASQLEPDQTQRNMGVEPLPDLDFNICSGNTLVGFASFDQVRKTLDGKLPFPEVKQHIALIEKQAEAVDKAFSKFHRMQIEQGLSAREPILCAKEGLQTKRQNLLKELDKFLAGEYAADINERTFKAWSESHKPFHWFGEFSGIFKAGGFDVIIGNPPYVEYSKIKKDYTIRGYETLTCGNLYANVVERCFDILRHKGRVGMIVQLPIICTNRMKPLQQQCLRRTSGISFANFDDRPARLFDGLEHIRASIFTCQKGECERVQVSSTTYNRWYSEARPSLFERLSFSDVSAYLTDGAIPKIGDIIAKRVRERLIGFAPIKDNLVNSARSDLVYFHNAPQYWIRAMNFIPYFWNERDGEQISTHIKRIQLPNDADASVVVATLNSSLFYWWFILLSNCRDFVMREIESFPLGLDHMPQRIKTQLAALAHNLMADLMCHKERKECEYKATGKVVYDEFYPKHSKPIIDEIDRVLAQHYGFTADELDFIINYDIKYRMGLQENDKT